LPSLLPPAVWNRYDSEGEVLNGIAYDPSTNHLLLTGKHWPTIFEVTVREVTGR
jgi:glutaminyl-peptide cyclotransferase